MLVFTNGLFAQGNYQYPFQNPQLSADERVDDLVSRLTLKEKLTQLFNHSEAIDRLGVPAYDWWNECLHGVARAGKATVFPQAIGLAATFDPDMMHRVADVISDEARAKHHYFAANNIRSIYTGLTFWTPNINIFRDPRWGRGQETYGEDPFLTGTMAVSFIKGIQGNDPKYLKAIATAKHYAVHSGPEYTRHSDNFYVNDRDLYDTYLPAFKMTVRDANVQSIMCAYNRFRDKPCCGSDILLSNILRDRYGFNGYVVSDCGAISDFYTKNAHKVVETPAQAWGWSISTGTDLNCETSRSFITSNIDSAIQAGILNESDINISVKRLFKARFMLGMFDPQDQVAFTKIPMTVVGSEKHLKLTQEAAEKSLVLLKNNGVLPIKNVKKVALIGPNANNFAILIGNYNGDPIRPVTPLKAFRDKLGAANVLYSQGCPIVPGIYGDQQIIAPEFLFHHVNGKLQKGLKAEYFENTRLEGQPKIVRVDPNINFAWPKSPINNLLEENFSVRWTGVIVPKKSGNYIFSGNVRVKVDGKSVGREGIALEKGKQYELVGELRVASTHWANAIEPSATLSWVESTYDYRKEALEAAAKADVVVFCGGISADLEGEEMPLEIDGFSHGDRTHINLPKVQEDLLKDLHKSGKPVVFVNFSGSAMALNWEDQNLPAVVQAFYPGEAAGTALVRMLFGDFNPSGRLPVTFYKSEKDLPSFMNYNMEGRTYRYFKGTPLYPFGFGLSYTTFAYSNLKVAEASSTNAPVTVTVDVKNTGTMDGEEVVQVYVSKKNAESAPISSLKSFQRVFLKKGEQKTVTFTLTPEAFSLTNADTQQVVEPGKYEITSGGAAPGKNSLVKSILMTGITVEID
jgi:beta-glucosidase